MFLNIAQYFKTVAVRLRCGSGYFFILPMFSTVYMYTHKGILTTLFVLHVDPCGLYRRLSIITYYRKSVCLRHCGQTDELIDSDKDGHTNGPENFPQSCKHCKRQTSMIVLRIRTNLSTSAEGNLNSQCLCIVVTLLTEWQTTLIRINETPILINSD